MPDGSATPLPGMRAAVLAGGLGTRLRGRLGDLPKAMAPVGGRPFLEYLLAPLVQCGIHDIVLCLGQHAAAIQDHFGARFGGASLHYSVEERPLGTGGAIARALGTTSTAPALVLNGDSLLAIDYAELFRWYRAAPVRLAMVLARVADTGRFGAVRVDGETVSGFSEKGGTGPGLISAGIYLLKPQIFSELELSGVFSFEFDVLERHRAALAPRAYICEADFLDIGVPEDLERAQRGLPGARNSHYTPRGPRGASTP